MNYTVLVVEDMPVIRQGLVNLLKEHYSFCIKEAGNGIEALEIIRQFEVDFVLIDIKMPKCNGLEFLKRLQEMNRRIPAIIISGYNDFEYAEKAIQYGVSGYLLKPIEEDKFHHAIQKLEREVEHLRSQALLFDRYQEIQQDIRRQEHDKRVIEKLFSKEKIYYKDHYYTVVIILFSLKDMNYTYLFELTKKFWRKHTRFSPEVVRHPILENQLILVFDDSENHELELYYECLKFTTYFQGKDIHQFCISISTTNQYLNKEVYLQADAVGYLRFFDHHRHLFRYTSKNEDEKEKEIIVNEIYLKLLQQAVNDADFLKIKELLTALFTYNEKIIHPKKLFYRLLEKIQQISIQHYGPIFSNPLSPLQLNEDYFGLLLSQQELIQHISAIFEERPFTKEDFNNDSGNLVIKVKQYIANHYNEEIVVKELAELFNINYSYLSSVFKKEEGQTIVSYIKQLRMKKAQVLLTETTNSINMIAEIVGYPDVQYFYKVFKQFTGQTPLSYRNSKLMTIKD